MRGGERGTYGPRTQAVYYRDEDGGQPVKEYIDAQEPAVQASIDWEIDLLNALPANTPPLPFPHTSQVEGELRELRCNHGSTLYRILYRRSERLFVLLHILEKRTGKIPEGDKSIARRRWDDFRRRMDENPRTPPRAAGSDAP